VEALQEFRVETSSFAPEFGKTPAAGHHDDTVWDERFHGGLYEYFRNDVMDANDWFANQIGTPALQSGTMTSAVSLAAQSERTDPFSSSPTRGTFAITSTTVLQFHTSIAHHVLRRRL